MRVPPLNRRSAKGTPPICLGRFSKLVLFVRGGSFGAPALAFVRLHNPRRASSIPAIFSDGPIQGDEGADRTFNFEPSLLPFLL